MIRQLVAFALGAAMLNLNALRADPTCASHRHSGMDGAASHAMHGESMSHMAHTESPDADNCQTPVQADCCTALVTCSVTLGLDGGNTLASGATVHDVIAPAIQIIPLSRVTGPEPPPPRA